MTDQETLEVVEGRITTLQGLLADRQHLAIELKHLQRVKTILARRRILMGHKPMSDSNFSLSPQLQRCK